MSSSSCGRHSPLAERRAAAAVALALLLGAAPLRAADAAASAAAAAPLTRERVDEAAEVMRRDPRLVGTETEKTLRFKRDDKPPAAEPTPDWLLWLQGLVRWLSESGRFIVWALAFAVVAVLALRLRQWLRGGREMAAAAGALRPTHVNKLDIRPEALPADIGAAALALWREGRLQEAMSLLYRGALSRLVHGHGVPIRASSTEGDCLRLARPHLAEGALRYFALLVDAWRATVYAARPPADSTMQLLCTEFDRRLPAPLEAAP